MPDTSGISPGSRSMFRLLSVLDGSRRRRREGSEGRSVLGGHNHETATGPSPNSGVLLRHNREQQWDT